MWVVLQPVKRALLIRVVANLSMTKRWQMGRATSSNPLLRMFALRLLFLPMSLSIFRNSHGFLPAERIESVLSCF